ncbi:MAG: carbon-nitrogen hydrolase family protein [Verrucomicrobiota bacterium]
MPKNPSERTAAPLFRPVAALAAAALLFSGSVCTPAAESLSDPQFARGFDVHDPAPGKHVPRGAIQPRSGAGEPEWVLAQWSCRSSLHQAAAESLPDGSVCFADAGKAVTFGPVSGAGHSLTFALNGIGEYGGRLRQPDEPWIHLLAEQPIASHPPFLELAELRFRMRCRLLRAESGLAQDQIKPWHAAQFLAYLTVQDQNRHSPHYGDFFWFGVPIYDNRYRVPTNHAALDAGTRKFIYNPPGSAYTSQSVHDGQWVTIDRDLLPLMREGLAAARERGFLVESKDADLKLGSFNIGWEVPGLLDVAMQFEGLSLQARPVPSAVEGAALRSLRVAAVQMRSSRDLADNAARINKTIRECAAQGARVVVFPECALSGYFESVVTNLTSVQLAQAEQQIADTCREAGVYAVVGTPHREGDRLFNSAAVISPSGKVLERYHKIQLAERWPDPGGQLSVFQIDGVSCSIIICHDERYPELVRLPVLAGAKVIFYLSHESGLREEHKLNPYRAQIQARAVENTVFVVQANAPANQDATGSHGQSRVIAPDGNILQEASIFGEERLLADLDLPKATRDNAKKSLDRGPLQDWWKAGLQRVRQLEHDGSPPSPAAPKP